jgi:hypothetical protein
MNRLRNHFILGQTIYSSTLPQIPRAKFQETKTEKPGSGKRIWLLDFGS